MTIYDSDFILLAGVLLGIAAVLGLALVLSKPKPDIRTPWEL